jgi:two-component system chemotaxis response regulator CheB
MGQDGMHGCQHIQSRGGQVIVQDEASSVVWGMPGFVVKSKLADAVLPLNKIADEIMMKCQTGRLASLVAGHKEVK